ncbi:MAG: hypothetical protein CMJ46_14410 [Planctomyces sp.]|nr:hypothetical protein [Planctomyces sp.]
MEPDSKALAYGSHSLGAISFLISRSDEGFIPMLFRRPSFTPPGSCPLQLGLSLISYGLLIVAVATAVLVGSIELCIGYLLISLAVQGLSLNHA